MVYLKSLLAGVAALIVAALVICVAFFAGAAAKLLAPRAAGGDTYFVVLHWHLWPTLGVSLLVFAAGFWWQHRRTA